MQSSVIESNLKQACQISNVDWAVLVRRGTVAWELQIVHGLSSRRRANLLEFINDAPVDAWLCGALPGGNVRSKGMNPELGVPGARMYVFPVQEASAVILVGADELDSASRKVWQMVAVFLQALFAPGETVQPPLTVDALSLDIETDVPYDAPRALEKILTNFVHASGSQGGWLAVLRGDIFEIQAQAGCRCLGMKLLVDTTNLLRKINRSPSPRIISVDDPEWVDVPVIGLKKSTTTWGALPLVVGHRLVGLVALWRADPFPEDQWQRLTQIAPRAASAVDVVETFAEMSGHLRRLALLNDVALTVSSARNLDQIAKRIFGLINRTFGTELISLVLLSVDERILREYRNYSGRVILRSMALDGHSLAPYLKSGKMARLADVEAAGYKPLHDEAHSALIVPFRHHGVTIGALAIESVQTDAFNMYDEHLVVVISSHLAGLVEYGRLREEAEARARNLGLIHDVVQQVIGLTDKKEMAQITADLLAQYFAYELAVVLLADEDGELTIGGYGGASSTIVMDALERFKQPVVGGITGHVLETGKSLMVNDVSQNEIYHPVEGWDAQSELCVALQDDEKIIGLIDVESSRTNSFTHNDLLALESLAGILAGVVSSADQYLRLRATVKQLQVMQEELQTRIEAQRSAENRLVQAAKLAAVGEMAAGVAHELNNPLTTVSGFAELVMEEMEGESSQRSDMELILREARRARDVVRRLLDFARQGESTRSKVDLNEIVEDVVALTRHFVHTSGVQLEVTLGKNLPWVSVDRNQIKQVLLNLIHNSLQAMPDGGEMNITSGYVVRDDRDWVQVAIRDSGVGITDKDKDRIFEPFYTTRSGDGGTGLGLSVSYGIVTDHGGFIDVESETGKGSCFTVYLPI